MGYLDGLGLYGGGCATDHGPVRTQSLGQRRSTWIVLPGVGVWGACCLHWQTLSLPFSALEN